ncbi:Hypothetical protein A7982_05702 [Minicystis rosea]|nr:Hypothetical protein A7982_05702 [Minicystis rosea]
MHGAFALVGAVVIALIVRSVGPGALLLALKASARWLPVLIALELGRAGMEMLATLSLSERVRRRVRFGQLTRIHLIAYAVSNVMPAGRATGEAVKAAMLARYVGTPEATSIGTGNYAAALLGGALAAVPCAVVSLALTGWSMLTGLLLLFAAASVVLVVGFQIACRRPDIGGALVRRFMKIEQAPSAYQDAIGRIPLLPGLASAASFGSRALFAAQLGVLLYASSGSTGVGRAILALGVSMVGGALGDVVPGQLGASDGAFALAGPTLGITAADGVAMAMTMHVLQIVWGVLGWTLPLVWKAAPAPRDGADGLPAEG